MNTIKLRVNDAFPFQKNTLNLICDDIRNQKQMTMNRHYEIHNL